MEAVVTPQNLYEFYSVVTNPKRVLPPLPCEKAAEICRTIHESPELAKIHPSINTPIMALSLAEEHGLGGAGVFDCVLAATAKENGVEIIYTQNVDDFRRFGFIRVIDPFEDAAE
jgi:predicted nucleic acid-binding protein